MHLHRSHAPTPIACTDSYAYRMRRVFILRLSCMRKHSKLGNAISHLMNHQERDFVVLGSALSWRVFDGEPGGATGHSRL